MKTKKQGFASMSQKRRIEISSAAGKKSHKVGRAHTFTSEEASIAGKKGGRIRAANLKKSKQYAQKKKAI